MKTPKNLDPEALAFFKRHHRRLEQSGLLTESTQDSFIQLCRTHSLLVNHDPNDTTDKMSMIKFVALTKIYQSIAKGFGMNSDKAKKPVSSEDKDEFGL
jgi:hypothetical protein